jgi:beta-phosphoglucomutase-like phosphatase (HAD superfamily)
MTTSKSSPENEKLNSLLNRSRAFVLDFDGLIADSEPFHYKAYNAVFERYGHTIDPDEYWVEFTSKGTGAQGEIDRHKLQIPVSLKELRQQKFELYSQFCQSGEIPLFPAAQRMVRWLQPRYKIAIASGSWGHDIRAILRHSNAENLVTTILGKESAEREKPHPDIFINAATALQCAPGNCIVLEDAEKGLRAAQSAGMPCIIIRNRLNQNLSFPDADLVFPSLEDFVSRLESL